MILILGGAGYIGSHVAKQLLENKEKIIILDNLSTGNLQTINTLKDIYDFEFINEDLKNFDKIEEVFKTKNINTVMHFAASIVVSESVENPMKYYMNNTVNTANLISLVSKYEVKKVIFSSTAAVYGEPEVVSESGIDESYETKPINPYGMSKLMSENIIKDASKTSSFKYVIFRYFNVAGADMNYEEGNLKPRIGQCFPNATHLVHISAQCASLKRDKMYIYGNTYETRDGTCIRDYIHVEDLASSHILALTYLEDNESDVFNIGYTSGFSVKEVIRTMQDVTKIDFKVEEGDKRKGDPAILIANSNKIKEKMKWQSKYEKVELICESAYKWEIELNKRNQNNE